MHVQIINRSRRAFNARIVRYCEPLYGSDLDVPPTLHDKHDPVVEIFDAAAESKGGFSEFGQYVASFTRGELCRRSGYPADFMLHATNARWYLDSSAMAVLINWLAADPSIPSPIFVGSSHGTFEINGATGEVLSKHFHSKAAAEMPDEYNRIVRFDIAEWLSYWNEPIAPHFDILDLGYWYQDSELMYEEPSVEHRDLVLQGLVARID